MEHVTAAVPDHTRMEGEEATDPTGVGDVPQPRGRRDGPGSGPMTEPKRLRESVDSESTSEKNVHPRRQGKRIRTVAVGPEAPEAVAAASRRGSTR